MRLAVRLAAKNVQVAMSVSCPTLMCSDWPLRTSSL